MTVMSWPVHCSQACPLHWVLHKHPPPQPGLGCPCAPGAAQIGVLHALGAADIRVPHAKCAAQPRPVLSRGQGAPLHLPIARGHPTSPPLGWVPTGCPAQG